MHTTFANKLGHDGRLTTLMPGEPRSLPAANTSSLRSSLGRERAGDFTYGPQVVSGETHVIWLSKTVLTSSAMRS